jgi:hypothetical protein
VGVCAHRGRAGGHDVVLRGGGEVAGGGEFGAAALAGLLGCGGDDQDLGLLLVLVVLCEKNPVICIVVFKKVKRNS